jgi:hypothetical protein
MKKKKQGSKKIKTFLFLFLLVAMQRGIGEKKAQLQYTNDFVKK